MNREQRRFEQKSMKNPGKFVPPSMKEMKGFMDYVKNIRREEYKEDKKILEKEIPDLASFARMSKTERTELLRGITKKYGFIVSSKKYIDPIERDEFKDLEEIEMGNGLNIDCDDIDEYKIMKHKFVKETSISFFINIVSRMVKYNEDVASFREDITDRIKKRKWNDKIIPKIETFINKISEPDFYETGIKQLPQEVTDDVVMMAMMDAYRGYDEVYTEHAADYPNINNSIQKLSKSDNIKSAIENQIVGIIEKYEEAYKRQRDCIIAAMKAFPLVDWKSCVKTFNSITSILKSDHFPEKYKDNRAIEILINDYFSEGQEKANIRNNYPEIVAKIHEISDKYDDDYKNNLKTQEIIV